MKLTELKPDSRNANKGTARGRKMVEQSLRSYGAGRSILIDKNGHIIAGNKTAEGAKAAGLTDVQIVKSDGSKLIAVQRTDLDITDPKARELAIADNRASEVSLEWDVNVLAEFEKELSLDTFWSPTELEQLLADVRGEKEAPEPQIDKAAELEQKWGTKLGQIWEIGKHRLMCDSATDEEAVKALLSGHTPLLCVTDPPYGVNYDPSWRNVQAAKGNLAYGARRVSPVSNDDRADWRKAWELFPGDVIYSWHPAGAPSLVHAAALQASGFILRMQIIWAKSNFPIGRGDYHVRHEPCWYAVREGKPAKRTDDRKQTTLWEINLDRNVEGGHSTQKPLECMARPIRNHEFTEVYDPFLGSGTTMVAAEQLGRICYAMELEPKYVAVSLQRLADMGLTPRLANG